MGQGLGEKGVSLFMLLFPFCIGSTFRTRKEIGCLLWDFFVFVLLPDPRGAGLALAFQISSVRTYVRTSVRPYVRLHLV